MFSDGVPSFVSVDELDDKESDDDELSDEEVAIYIK